MQVKSPWHWLLDPQQLGHFGKCVRVLALRGMLRSVASQVSSVVPGGLKHPEDLPSCSWSREVRHTSPAGQAIPLNTSLQHLQESDVPAKLFKKLKHRRDLGSVKWGTVSSLG